MNQTHTPSRTRAVILVPPHMSLDSQYASGCVTYAIGRGYKSIALRRDWDDIDPMLRAGYAHVVVVAREEHGVDKGGEVSGATVTDLDRYREGVNTRPLVPPTQDMTSTADRVRRILDGDEPAPDEVAPETVAALRLLWWRLRNRS